MKEELPRKDRKLLWGKSHKLCALCKTELIETRQDESDYLIGVEAHIEGEKPNSARYNLNIDTKIKNSYENRILLCPTCHTKIDNDEKYYTVDKLKQNKKEHEQWCDQALKHQMPNITYADLEIILRHMEKNFIKEEDEKLIPIHPKDKIMKNELSEEIADNIKIGLLKFPLVKNFINEFPDINFGDRLRSIFVKKYHEFKKEHSGDALFYTLWDFASGCTNEFNRRVSGLAVLSYFFQQCDVFEI